MTDQPNPIPESRGAARPLPERSLLALRFDALLAGMFAIVRGWRSDRDRADLRRTCGEVRHAMCMALSFLDEAPQIPCARRATREELARARRYQRHELFDKLDREARSFAHEAYLAVLALGQLMRRAREDKLALEDSIGLCSNAALDLLDALSPYIGRADHALRRVLLHDDPIEVAARTAGARGVS